jgi:hypothetical protein
MNTQEPVIGNRYDRKEISAMLGGGDIRSYLPSRKGTILAGCFDPSLNRSAPSEIDVGTKPEVVRYAKILGKARSEIPIFLKRGPKKWEYIGRYRCLRFSQQLQDIKARTRRPDAAGVLYFREVEAPSPAVPDLELLEHDREEGRRRLVLHFVIERSRRLVTQKRAEVRRLHGYLRCEACGLTESELPNSIGEACFEAHHKTRLSGLSAPKTTRLEDIAMLCANCHRMIHRHDPMPTVETLQNRLQSAKFSE